MRIIIIIACALIVCSAQQIMDVSYGCQPALCGQLDTSYGRYQCPVPGNQKATLLINGSSATLTIFSNLNQSNLPIKLDQMTANIYYTYMQLPNQMVNQIFTLNKCVTPDQNTFCYGGWDYYVQVQDTSCQYALKVSKPEMMIPNNLRGQDE